MVSRVGKFVGGLGVDVTNVANVHATENRIALGASINPTANVHVVGNAHVSTTFSTGGNIIGGGTYTGGGLMTTGGNIVIPNDGDVGSVGATDAIQISSGGIVTFKDDIKIKDDGTIGSASAAGAMTIDSSGIVTFVDDIKIKDDGTIGSASAATAMTIDSSGIVTFVDDIKIKDGGTIGSASDPDAIAIGADGDVTLTQDLELQHDGAVISFGTNDEITLTHVHNTGLLLEDSGGSPTLQFHDANESVSSDGSKLILTSNGVAFDLPTADGSSGQVIKTDGSGALSFTDITTDLDPATELASDTDCGTAESASDSVDAFGIAINNSFVELDLRTQGANKLGTVDMGAF